MLSKNHKKKPPPSHWKLCNSPCVYGNATDISSWSYSSYQLSLALEDNLPWPASSHFSMSSSTILHPPEIKGTSAWAWVFWEAEMKYSIKYLQLPKGFVQMQCLKILKVTNFLPVMLETQIWSKSEGNSGFDLSQHYDKWTGTKEGVDHSMRLLSLLMVLNNRKYKVPKASVHG